MLNVLSDFSSPIILFSTPYTYFPSVQFYFHVQFVDTLRRKNQRLDTSIATFGIFSVQVSVSMYVYPQHRLSQTQMRSGILASYGGVTFIPAALSIGLIQCQNSRLKSVVILRSGTVVESRAIYICLITREMFAAPMRSIGEKRIALQRFNLCFR